MPSTTARVNHPIADQSNTHQASIPTVNKNHTPNPQTTTNSTQNDQRIEESARERSATLFQEQRLRNQNSDMRRTILTTHNHQTNSPWGDPITQKRDTITRVYALNLNGIALDRRGGQFATLCSIAKELQVDILCGQEHNVDTSQNEVRSILYNTAQHHWPRTRLVTGSTPVQFTNWYKPGDTLQLSIGHITGRIISTCQDPLGRWVSQTFTGRDGVHVTVISAYQVVEGAPKPGTLTAAAQQISYLTHTNAPDCNPRRAFKQDLRTYLNECIRRGDEF
jgi:hypothetical protein